MKHRNKHQYSPSTCRRKCRAPARCNTDPRYRRTGRTECIGQHTSAPYALSTFSAGSVTDLASLVNRLTILRLTVTECVTVLAFRFVLFTLFPDSCWSVLSFFSTVSMAWLQTTMGSSPAEAASTDAELGTPGVDREFMRAPSSSGASCSS
jgi:hypothetical protein